MAARTVSKTISRRIGQRRKHRLIDENGQHIHTWRIESPNGPVSTGTCVCGETKQFSNSSEDSIWDKTEGRSRWNDMGIAKRRRDDVSSS